MASEPIPAQITIGGVLSASTRLALAEAIASNGVSLECGGDSLDVKEALAAIDEAIQDDDSLTLFDDQANYGHFHDIEALCADARLPYSRACEARYEYDGEVSYFDGTTEHFAKADQAGDPIIPLFDLQKAREKGKIDELIAWYELAGSSPPPLKRTPEFEAEHEEEIARFRAAVLAERADADEDVCAAGSPAFGGYCGDADCVCGGVPLSMRLRVEAV